MSKGNPHPSNPTLVEWPVIQGHRNFSLITGFPLSFVKAVLATAEGAKAVNQNRIKSLQFILVANKLLHTANELPAGFSTWKEFREMNEARIAEVKRKESQKLSMSTAEGQRQAADVMAMTFSELDRRDRELPPSLAGRNAVEISERMSADTKGIKKTLAQKFAEIGK